MRKKQCTVCKNYTLPKESSDEICKVCFWQDDPVTDNHNPEVQVGGPNEVSVNRAIENYAQFGAYYEKHTANVRPPKLSEKPNTLGAIIRHFSF